MPPRARVFGENRRRRRPLRQPHATQRQPAIRRVDRLAKTTLRSVELDFEDEKIDALPIATELVQQRFEVRQRLVAIPGEMLELDALGRRRP